RAVTAVVVFCGAAIFAGGGVQDLAWLQRWDVVGCVFFHAEDGIRDGHVTGVQTCALPISSMLARGTPNRSAKYRRVPATAPQLPHTELRLTRASRPSAVASSITRSNGMTLATRSANAPSVLSPA